MKYKEQEIQIDEIELNIPFSKFNQIKERSFNEIKVLNDKNTNILEENKSNFSEMKNYDYLDQAFTDQKIILEELLLYLKKNSTGDNKNINNNEIIQGFNDKYFKIQKKYCKYYINYKNHYK